MTKSKEQPAEIEELAAESIQPSTLFEAMARLEASTVQFIDDNLVDSPNKSRALLTLGRGFMLAHQTAEKYGCKPYEEPEAEEGGPDGGEE